MQSCGVPFTWFDCKMIDLFSFNKSFKTIWIKKYLDKTNMGKWRLFVDLELGTYGGEAVFLGNLDKIDIRKTTSKLLIYSLMKYW